ncbi:hypothetical protein [Mycolicibacterium anyangense]|uniref:hypothetical protein n=1 Tax=Mycolicibacterium anyangense TaxID=1431246 RepID=UPI0013D5ADEC|nr:hypothetical protein [Mycolicibacterium anyangense]
MKRLVAASLLPLAMTAAGCAQNEKSPAVSSTGSATATHTHSTEAQAGGQTHCTKGQLADAAASAARSMGKDNVYSIDDLQCADGWAVTSGLLASTQNPHQGAPTSFVFRAQGQFWVVQDKAKVCGTNPTATTAPADATIPATLFVAGCAAG